MKIVIPGGTGHVGTLLAQAFHGDDHEVVVFSRLPKAAPWRVVRWNPEDPRDWPEELEGADVVINLAGRSVNCRYTQKNRDEILQSRVSTARAVGRAILNAKRPPALWLQASTATIYAHRYDAANDEASGLIGGEEPGAPDTWRFSIDVATAWERALDEAPTPRTRKVKLRSAVVMSPDPGGAFSTLLTLVRRGFGGTAGDGRQYVSWIHEADFIRAIDWLIEREHLGGAVNVAAPNPLPHKEFMSALRQAWGAPIGLPATKWMLELGAIFLGTETELILKSRRVVPGRLLADGFSFQYPEWPIAAKDLCALYRRMSKR
ncbi:MAG TPA: TIGR01777 family oxidoreductase [Thermoanaerobaculia bacterium]